jgi:hypothetical protein
MFFMYIVYNIIMYIIYILLKKMYIFTGVWAQGFTLSRQASYHLIHNSALLVLVTFEKCSCSCFFAWADLDLDPSIYAFCSSWDNMDMPHHHDLLLVEVGEGLANCLPRPTWNYNPPNLISTSWVFRMTVVSHWCPTFSLHFEASIKI